MSVKNEMSALARAAKNAARYLNQASSEIKNNALREMAGSLLDKSALIIRANRKDLAAARKEKRSAAFLDRLRLDKARVRKMSRGLQAIAGLPDPVGEMIKMWNRPNGLMIGRMRVPIGVIGIIYESRPDVTSDCAGLCLKSGNAVILRGGRESIHSNLAIYAALRRALKKSGLPGECVNLVETTDRAAVNVLLKLTGEIDLIIPRGGESLIRFVVNHSRVPVIKHYKGICHTYVDESADLSMAEEVAFNAKVQRPSTCNAMECLLVHESVAADFLPRVIRRMSAAGVEIRGCEKTIALCPGVKKARPADYAMEYLDLILSVKVVPSLSAALEHIARYGTNHSEAIITGNSRNTLQFLRQVDAACVYLNASTRFTDGYEFGFGAEIGISTDKLHARGPMGLEELTTYKYIILGNGQLRT